MEKIEKVTKKLDLIESAWRNYIWESNYLKSKIGFNNELKTNYVGAIFGNFHDTFPLLKENHYNNLNFSFFYSVGLLQIIYVQQDLVRELYQVFNIKQKNGRNKNRQIRNELIGHPISRDAKTKDLKSFTLFAYTTNSSTLSYLKYSKKNDFKFESVNYNFKEILDSHFKFLDFRFDKILKRINEIFDEYLKILEKILLDVDNIEFENLIINVDKNFNSFFKQNIVFEKQNILKCYKIKNSHLRYNYNLNYFLRDLKSYLIQTINTINVGYLSNQRMIDDFNKPLKSNYDFGKLYENHPIFGIKYFKKIFSDNDLILEELKNMELNTNNKFEYYCSYNYLQFLITIHRPDFF